MRSKIRSQDLLLLISAKNYIFTSCYSLSDRGMTNVGGKVISQSLTHSLAKRLDSSKKLHIWSKRLCISRVICWSVLGLNFDDHHDNCEPRRISGSGGTEIIKHRKNGVLLFIGPSGPKATRLHLFPLWSLFYPRLTINVKSIKQWQLLTLTTVPVTTQMSLQMIFLFFSQLQTNTSSVALQKSA